MLQTKFKKSKCKAKNEKRPDTKKTSAVLKYKAVVFDLGGVYYKNGVLSSLPHFTGDHFTKKEIYDLFHRKYIQKLELGKLPAKEFWSNFKKDIKTDKKITEMKQKVFEFFKPITGMEKLVRDCRKKVKVGLLTNNIKEWFNHIKKHTSIEKEFDSIVVSAEVATRKPSRKIYQIMLKKLNIKPEECVFFDDFMENVEGAKKLKIKSFKFISAEDIREKLTKLGIL